MRSIDQRAPAGKVEIPIADRPWPAGSGIDDFPTPTGIRNSKRLLTGRICAWPMGKPAFICSAVALHSAQKAVRSSLIAHLCCRPHALSFAERRGGKP